MNREQLSKYKKNKAQEGELPEDVKPAAYCRNR